ncbi:sulfite exporter TauE/SafE family protein [Sideroxydans sp. CL21]|uniref:sulfite exporter TauE/SafE family protein n=1 Tax=Sideroxydans sp. CL21 TaxID=2600596 RepID=UPI0012A9E535|nr:sulfite exporter TauE/SafE family protein [Sideroxydans sp. CL21]VVC85284.1 Heavy-metal-associated domain (N-terminus) and membrane-bounded cytochrome biogenesis cycZ-like domain, possible membrane copper tolerance protein [Sideroxydans sp. CL21]
MVEFSLVAVFLVGLLSGVHCLGMCGSIVGVFTAQVPKDAARWPFHLAYSSGRIMSYAMAGALVGAVGQAGLLMRDAVPVQHLLFTLSSLMLVVLGLYLAGVWGAVRQLERLGGGLWKRLQPYTTRLLPVNTVPRALGLGALWGWLPCGLVYSVLLTALASGNAMRGALIMLAFGLGTLPNLLAIGLFWEGIKGWVQSPRVRLMAGLLVAMFGVYGLIKVGYTFYINGWSGSCHVPA